jgi:hypothetical protein
MLRSRAVMNLHGWFEELVCDLGIFLTLEHIHLKAVSVPVSLRKILIGWAEPLAVLGAVSSLSYWGRSTGRRRNFK